MNSRKLTQALLLGAAVLLPLAGSTRAQDAAPGKQRWAGFHIGLHGGHGWANTDTYVDPLPSATQFVNLKPQFLDLSPSGSVYGAQFGYDWQWGKFVLGLEGDYTHMNLDDTNTQSPIIQNNGTPFPGAGYVTAHSDLSWITSARARVGATPLPNWLIYATGGLARSHADYSAAVNFRPVGTTLYAASVSRTHNGPIGGIGTEVGIGSHWSVGAQYLLYSMGNTDVTVDAVPYLPPFKVHYQFQHTGRMLNVGVNYKF
jgi:outer membrane immunogenic protein